MPSSRKGFTLIELLVVISIIALLSTIVLTSVSSQRNRAKDVSFQSTANSIQSSIGICCSGGTGIINAVLTGAANPRGDVCNPVSGSIYPVSANLGSATIDRGCDDVQGFSVELKPGASNAGTIVRAVCGHDGCEFFRS